MSKNVQSAFQQYQAVEKMTGLELAKIEADELHPLYNVACEEIDARANGTHALELFNREEADFASSMHVLYDPDHDNIDDDVDDSDYDRMREIDSYDYDRSYGFVDIGDHEEFAPFY